MKTQFFKSETFENDGFAFKRGWKTFWKTDLFENDDIVMIKWFPWPSFTQTQILNDRRLLRFQISPAQCRRKTFDTFSEWKIRFQFLRHSVCLALHSARLCRMSCSIYNIEIKVLFHVLSENNARLKLSKTASGRRDAVNLLRQKCIIILET